MGVEGGGEPRHKQGGVAGSGEARPLQGVVWGGPGSPHGTVTWQGNPRVVLVGVHYWKHCVAVPATAGEEAEENAGQYWRGGGSLRGSLGERKNIHALANCSELQKLMEFSELR